MSDATRATGSVAGDEAGTDLPRILFATARPGAQRAHEAGLETTARDIERPAKPRHRPNCSMLCDEPELNPEALAKYAVASLGCHVQPSSGPTRGAAIQSPAAQASLAGARKGRRRISFRFADPFAQHVLVQVQTARGLRNRPAPVADQPHRLQLELSAELSSLHCHLPDPKTPYLGVHEIGSSSPWVRR